MTPHFSSHDVVDDHVSIVMASLTPLATVYLMRANRGCVRAGIKRDDMLVVDGSVSPVDGNIIVVQAAEGLTLQRLSLFPHHQFHRLEAIYQVLPQADAGNGAEKGINCLGVVMYAFNASGATV
ncbi:hypothetical protein ACL2XP_18125 [Sodalis sp. RH21]|uniref:hypothetical protein n=1 Tax=unclassified Sodalis (in: enterobacteria) TaxID=2636512 RepID=UPI0039B41DE9